MPLIFTGDVSRNFSQFQKIRNEYRKFTFCINFKLKTKVIIAHLNYFRDIADNFSCFNFSCYCTRNIAMPELTIEICLIFISFIFKETVLDLQKVVYVPMCPIKSIFHLVRKNQLLALKHNDLCNTIRLKLNKKSVLYRYSLQLRPHIKFN